MSEFTCQRCGVAFSLPQHILDRYPGWTPPLCLDCRETNKPAASRPAGGAGGARPRTRPSGIPTTEMVLKLYDGGPSEGVFTDGSSVPNPGPGGWGVVYVVAGELVAEEHGHDPDTTNNRMELTALIHGAALVPDGIATTVFTDSKLAVNTITQWAAGWEKRGWKRKSGPVENLDLVKAAYSAFRMRPELDLQWIAAHSGHRWNEYADALASRWRLGE